MQKEAESIPPPPETLRSVLTLSHQELRICWREQGTGGLGLGIFLIFWMVICTAKVVHDFRNSLHFELIVSLVFLAIGISLCVAAVSQILALETFLLNETGITVMRRSPFSRSSRHVDLSDIREVSVRELVYNKKTVIVLEFWVAGEPLRILRNFPMEELQWSRAVVTERLHRLRVLKGLPAEQSLESQDLTITLDRQGVPPLPAGSRWQRLTDGDLVFECQGRLPVGWGTLLFFTCFWDGIVFLVVGSLLGCIPVQGGAPHGSNAMWMALFISPFAVIGLWVLVGCLINFAEPWHIRTWHLSHGGIESRDEWFGKGPGQFIAVDRMSKLCMHRSRDITRGRWTFRLTGRNEEECRLRFVDDAGQVVCTVPLLDEHEARWMAQIILRERAEWFRSVPT